METLIEQIGSKEKCVRTAALTELLNLSLSNGGLLVLSDPCRFLVLVQERLCSDSDEVSVAQRLLLSIIPEFGPELEVLFRRVLPSVISLLADDRSGIAKSSLELLTSYIKSTGNIEAVISELVRTGLSAPEWRMKHQTLQCILPLLALDNLYTTNVLEMKKLFEALIEGTKDEKRLVAETAREVAKELSSLCVEFDEIYNRLVFRQQQLLNGILGRTPKNSFLNRNKQNKTHTDGTFGFLPQEVRQQIEAEDWKTRIAGLEQLETLVESAEWGGSVWVLMQEFLAFLRKTLEDTNIKAVTIALRVVERVLATPHIAKCQNLKGLLSECIKALGDNKLTVRQAAFRALLSVPSEVKTKLLFPLLIENLNSPNCNVVEGTIHQFIFSILSSQREYEFASVVPSLIPLTENAMPGIRQSSIEAITAIAYYFGKEKTLFSLKQAASEPLTKKILEKLCFYEPPRIINGNIQFSRPGPTVSLKNNVAVNNPKPSSEYALSASPLFSTVSSKPNDRLRPLRVSPPASSKVFQSVAKNSLLKAELARPTDEFKPVKPKFDLHVQMSSSTVSSFNDGQTYMKYEELLPLESPESVLEFVLASKSDDWAIQFEVLNQLRRLVKHHSSLLEDTSTVHCIVLIVSGLGDSLRSSLSKNALIAAGEMCVALKNLLDNESSDLVKLFMKKVIDTNIFISEEATKSLKVMCQTLNESKIVVGLLSYSQNSRSAVVKAKICVCFSAVFEKAKQAILKLKHIENVLRMLGDLLSDASPNVRTEARNAFKALSYSLSNAENFNKLISRYLSDSTVKKIREIVSSRSETTMTRSTVGGLSRSNNGTANAASKRYRTVESALRLTEIDSLNEISIELAQSQWKKRYDAIESLFDFILQFRDTLKRSNKLISVIDMLSKGITDQNLKVQLRSLDILVAVVPVLENKLEPHLGILMSSLLHTVGSINSTVRETGKKALEVICEYCEGPIVLAALTANFPNSSPKAKGFIIEVLNKILFDVYAKKPNYIEKYLFRLIFELVGVNRLEYREEVNALVENVYTCTGNLLIEKAPLNKQNLIIDLVA